MLTIDKQSQLGMAMRVRENAPQQQIFAHLCANIAYVRQYADMRIDAHRKKSGAWPSLVAILSLPLICESVASSV